MPAILTDINWIDIVFIILLLGMVYKGSRTGVGSQIFSMIGLLILVLVSIKYYSVISEAIFGVMLQSWARPVSFCCIFVAIFTAIKVVERVVNVASDNESASIEKIGGAVVAVFRAFLLFGLIGIQLLLVPLDYMQQAVTKESKTCMFFVNLDAGIYSWMTGILCKESEEKLKSENVVKSFSDS